MKAQWYKITQYLPPLMPSVALDWCYESQNVLVFTKFGEQKIAYVRQWIDEDSQEVYVTYWISACSEGWDITKDVTHWAYLPENPL